MASYPQQPPLLLGALPPAPSSRNGGSAACCLHELFAYAAGATVVVLDVRERERVFDVDR